MSKEGRKAGGGRGERKEEGRREGRKKEGRKEGTGREDYSAAWALRSVTLT